MVSPIRAEQINAPATTSEAGTVTSSQFVRLRDANVSVKEFGAVGDGSTDDVAAIQAAITSLPSTGGVIFFPSSSGDYLCSGQLNFAGKKSVVLKGASAPTGGSRMASVLTYTGSAASFIIGAGVNGFTISEMQILYNNASFSGVLIDFDSLSGSPAFNILIENCFLGGSGVHGAAAILAIENTFQGLIHNTQFGSGVLGIRGPHDVATTFANGWTMTGGGFAQGVIQTALVKNCGQAWSFKGVSFESLISGAANSITSNIESPAGVSIENCWFGDVSNGGQHLSILGSGWTITGNLIAGDANSTAIRFGDGITLVASSVVIHGNTFSTHLNAITFPDAGVSVSAVSIHSNFYLNITNDIVQSPVSGFIENSLGTQTHYAGSLSHIFVQTGVTRLNIDSVIAPHVPIQFPDGLSDGTYSLRPATSGTTVGNSLVVQAGDGYTGFRGGTAIYGGGAAGDISHLSGDTQILLGAPVAGVSAALELFAGSSVGSSGRFLNINYNTAAVIEATGTSLTIAADTSMVLESLAGDLTLSASGGSIKYSSSFGSALVWADGVAMSLTQTQSTSGVGTAATIRPQQGRAGSAGAALTMGAGYGGTPGTDSAGILTIDLGATVGGISQEMFWKSGSSVGSGGLFLGLKYNGAGGGVFFETLGTELLNILSAADAYFRGSGDVHIGSIGSAKTLSLGFASSDKISICGSTARVVPARAGQLTDNTGGISGGSTVAIINPASVDASAAKLTDTQNAFTTVIARLNLLEGKISGAGTGIGVTA